MSSLQSDPSCIGALNLPAPQTQLEPQPQPVEDSAGSVFGGFGDNSAEDAAYAQYLAQQQEAADYAGNEETEYEKQIRLYQDQLDATRAVYGVVLNDARVAGQ